jgi:galactose mutarotase-like enzyme
MLFSISNKHLTVSADTKGAELRSVRNTKSGIEYLWQGNPEFWDGRAPLLFPVIGRLKKGTYSLKGKTYEMGLHGFARDSEFRGTRPGDDTLSFSLSDSPKTLASWPFAFELEIRYTLSNTTLRKDHVIHNRGASEMLYEIGGHEGYNLALLPGETMRDYHLEFEGMETISSRMLDADTLITREKKTIPLEGGKLRLDMRLFDNDALILEEVKNRSVVIANSKNSERVRVTFPDFQYLGLWTRAGEKETNFVCVEPWSALPDCAYLDDELANKHGIRRLTPGTSETLSYTMDFGQGQ